MGGGWFATRTLNRWQWLGCSAVMTWLVWVSVGYWVYLHYQHFLKSPLNQWPSLNAVTIFEIEPGQGLRKITQRLQQQGLLSQAEYWEWLVLSTHQRSRLKTGEYEITEGMTPPQLLKNITNGKVKQYKLTIPEGFNFKQVLQLLHQHPKLVTTLPPVDQLKQAGIELMQRLQRPEVAPEGLFLPDTFYFPKGLTDVEFLKRAYEAMTHYLAQQWSQRAPNLPYKSAYEALIMASIIEKESAQPEELPMIAGVFVRRLQKNMRLQTDPTVIYGMGDAYQGNIRREDLLQSTPYNTYVIDGLPPTPIAMPGRLAIKAALQPAPGEYLYFVAKGNSGWHHFSVTLAEHNEAVQKYQLSK